LNSPLLIFLLYFAAGVQKAFHNRASGFYAVSYQARIEEMVGNYVAEFQTELTLAKKMGDILDNTPRMPYGYPLQVYRPMHFCQMPKVKQFIAKTGGKLSNGVPKVLSGEVVGGYLLGIYNTLNNCQS
jgi:hypothetical protein